MFVIIFITNTHFKHHLAYTLTARIPKLLTLCPTSSEFKFPWTFLSLWMHSLQDSGTFVLYSASSWLRVGGQGGTQTSLETRKALNVRDSLILDLQVSIYLCPFNFLQISIRRNRVFVSCVFSPLRFSLRLRLKAQSSLSWPVVAMHKGRSRAWEKMEWTAWVKKWNTVERQLSMSSPFRISFLKSLND